MLERLLNESEFLSEGGIRALSKYHKGHPYSVDIEGTTYSIQYEPGDSTSDFFGGNSNWRGPVWFPVNYLLVEALREYHKYMEAGYSVEYPTGSGQRADFSEIADDITRRLVSIFLDDGHGRRPVYGDQAKFQTDPVWHQLVPFHEYFHGDTGAGLGASHQTGWTGLVADLITRRRWESTKPPVL